MLLCKNRRLFTVAGDNSHVLTPIAMHLIPIPIPWLILYPFPWESHGTHGIPVFPIPMHTSTSEACHLVSQCTFNAPVSSTSINPAISLSCVRALTPLLQFTDLQCWRYCVQNSRCLAVSCLTLSSPAFSRPAISFPAFLAPPRSQLSVGSTG